MTELLELDYSPHNLPDRLLKAIGLAITSCAQTEDLIEMAISGCLGIDAEFGYAVTTHMTTPLRFSVLRSVAEIRLEVEPLDELDAILTELEDAFNRRNAIAHNQWGRDPKTGALYTIKQVARTRLETELIPMSIDQVELDAVIIYMAGIHLFKFLKRHNLMTVIPPLRPRFHKSKAERKKRGRQK